MKTEDTVDRRVRTAHTFVHHHNSTQSLTQRQFFFQYSPSSRPTSHLRCGQVEVRGWVGGGGMTRSPVHTLCNISTTTVTHKTLVTSVTLATASSKSSCVTWTRRSRSAYIPASVHTPWNENVTDCHKTIVYITNIVIIITTPDNNWQGNVFVACVCNFVTMFLCYYHHYYYITCIVLRYNKNWQC